LLYASASRGFKAGVFPSQNNVVQNVGAATAPERILSYETGAKTDWLNQRVRVNAAAYVTDARDLQLSRLDPQLRLVTFTEDARIKGLEIELSAAVLAGLEVGAVATLMDAVIVGGANDGNRLQRSPKRKFGGYAEKSWVLGSGDLSARLDYYWTDRFFTDVPNDRIQLVPSYGLLDMRVGYRWRKPNVELAVWGRNLSDELYAVHTISFLGNGFSLYGAPRTFGVSLQWGATP
jgi:iron complex outermembrane receptor protein